MPISIESLSLRWCPPSPMKNLSPLQMTCVTLAVSYFKIFLKTSVSILLTNVAEVLVGRCITIDFPKIPPVFQQLSTESTIRRQFQSTQQETVVSLENILNSTQK